MSVRIDRDKRGRKRIVCDQRWPDGKRFRRMKANRKAAEQLDARITVAIANGTWPELRLELEGRSERPLTVSQFAEHYLEVYCKVHNKGWKRKRDSLKAIKRHFGRLRLKSVDRKHVHTFIARRMNGGVKAATINRDLSTLRHMLEFAVEVGTLTENPIFRTRKLKEIRSERPRVSETHLKAVLKHLPFPVEQLVVFIYETGCRPSEAMQLKWEHVDLERKTVVLNLRKGGDNALVALTSRAAKAVSEVPALSDCPYVFWNGKTKSCYQRINETFNRARDKAGLPWLQLKDFRRAVAITIAESGQPLHVAQAQLGHSSIRTTEKYYAHFSPEFAISRARKALENRGRHKGGTPPEPENPPESMTVPKSNVIDFTRVRKAKTGGGGRIRTDA